MDAEKIANQARKSISRFCIDECKAYCCRKGYLIITNPEKKVVMQKLENVFKEKKLIRLLEDGRYSLFLGTPDMPCPSLCDFKCLIHKKRSRPLTCREFPVFVRDNVVVLSGRCLAVKQNKFYPFIRKWKSMGLKVIESNCFEF